MTLVYIVIERTVVVHDKNIWIYNGLNYTDFFVHSKDIQFGVKFKPQPHSGWKSGDNEIEDIWVEELEPIADYESSITG